MQPLTEIYKPQTLDSLNWCGLRKQRLLLSNLAARPRSGVIVLLEGPSGVGKTSLAFAYGRTAGAEIHHIIGSQRPTSTDLEKVSRLCAYVAPAGTHLIVLDDLDFVGVDFQLACLSKYDATEPLHAVTIATCNDPKKIDERLLRRCLRAPECNLYGESKSVKALLCRAWREQSDGSPEPHYLSRASTTDVRAALNWLETAMLMTKPDVPTRHAPSSLHATPRVYTPRPPLLRVRKS